MIDSGFETRSLRMELLLLVTFQAPAADVERIMEAVVAITPLRMGKYDANAYQSAQGIERYRPLEGAAPGAATEMRRRPGTLETHSRTAQGCARDSYECGGNGPDRQKVCGALRQSPRKGEPARSRLFRIQTGVAKYGRAWFGRRKAVSGCVGEF